MLEDIYILGGHVQALGVARQARAKGLDVHIIINDRCSIARFSNTVSETFVYKSAEQLLSYLSAVNEASTRLLFPTDDEMILFMVKHRDALKHKYLLGIPDDVVVDLFNDKKKTYRFAQDNDIPHPESWYPNSLSEVLSLSKQLDYPVVVKPSVMFSFHKTFGKKAYRCNNSNELIATCKYIGDKYYPIAGIVIQEFLSGGPQFLFSYGTFAVKGDPMAYLMVNRIRQNPMDFGNSTTFAITCNVPRIKELAEIILRLTNYTGLAEIEFMYDTKTNDYKFLEVNTRAWKWHTISNQQGFSFVGAWIEHFNGQLIENGNDKDVAWMERLTDIAVALKEVIHGRISLIAYLKTVFRKKEFAVWSWRDPLPAIMYALLSPILYVKRF